MSLNNVPSKAEVLGWSPQSLADYMKRDMTTRDLQVFPSLHVPSVAKIQSDINKGDQKKAFGQRSKAQKHPKQALVQEEEHWDSDEFDNESDNDYEHPEEDGYICALTEPQTAEQQDGEETYEETSERPSSADTPKPPRPPRVTKLQHSLCRDPVHKPSTAERTSKPPTPQRPFKAPASKPNLHIDRSRRPGQSGPSQTDLTKSKGGAFKAPSIKARAPKISNVFNRAAKVIPGPPVSTQAAKVNNSTPGQSKGLDPSWYGGKVTRHQAEVALREVNKDGAFVVRDSSHGTAEHPYTLMLLKQGKVYNIMIRSQDDSYSLGTGLRKTQSFPGVKQMITYHTDTPLLLIDATDQSAGAQSHCCLLHPAGL